MQTDFAISSTRVVTPAGEISAAIVIGNGTIVEIVEPQNVPASIPLTDFGDLVVSPGLVDAHVHINEPGRTDWEGFSTATAAAAAGGVTTIIDMPLNSSPVTTNRSALNVKRASGIGKCHVDVGFYGGLVPGNVDQLPSLITAGVMGVKAFMCDSGLDEFPASGENELRDALRVLKGSGVPLLVHAELVDNPMAEPSESRGIRRATDERFHDFREVEAPSKTFDNDLFRREPQPPEIFNSLSYRQYMNSRPPGFEMAAIKVLIRLCRELRTPIHIVHLATGKALPLIAAAKREGLPLTVETCPHYLLFSDERIEDGQTRFKCAPPIRDDANRRELCQAVADGLIDTIGSDHSPCPPALKCLSEGGFGKAWGGIAGLQLTLSAVWTVGSKLGWTPRMLADRLSSRPAEIFGLERRKGRIAAGFNADFVVWDPESCFVVRGEKLFHRHAVTAYEGHELSGKIYRTYLRGQLIYDAECLVGNPSGKLLIRGAEESCRLADYLNELTPLQRSTKLEQCCASRSWIKRMVEDGPFANDEDVLARAGTAWAGLSEADWLEAFAAHPRIGDVSSLRAKYANTRQVAGREQAGVQSADESVLQQLAIGNNEYVDKFGFIFIVCATGKSAAEMLELLKQRLPNERKTELEIAAAEQLKITTIRLEKMIA